MVKIKEFLKVKKNRITIYAIVMFIITAVILCLITAGVFQRDFDYKYVKGGENSQYSKDLVKFISKVDGWKATEIKYKQIYEDEKTIENTILIEGKKYDNFKMQHYHIVNGDGYYEKNWYVNKKLYTEKNSGENIKVVTDIKNSFDFAQMKTNYIGDYNKYLVAFKATMFEKLMIKQQNKILYYKVVFTPSQSVSVLGHDAYGLEIIAETIDDELLSLTLKYNRSTNISVNEIASSSSLVFSKLSQPINFPDFTTFN
ncbi:MAG: hypothetical protein RR054_06445 [Clostridia bacterium]